MIGFLQKTGNCKDADFILPVNVQVKAWRKANRKMKWGIEDAEFAGIGNAPALTGQDRADGFAGVVLSYGFADYDVAPFGFNDFFDALQMFCSNGVLGLGIGNVDQNYPLFGIPTLRFPKGRICR